MFGKTDTTKQPKAVAFFNIEVRAADGSLHRLRKGIALDPSNHLENSLINKMKSFEIDAELAAEAGNDKLKELTFECVGSIHLVEDTTEKQEIEF